MSEASFRIAAALLGFLLCFPAASPAAPPAPEAAAGESELRPAGWLMNRAQQQLAQRDIEGALDSLRAALVQDPDEGFTHHLLAQIGVYGLHQREETLAVYEHISELPSAGEMGRVHRALAALEFHREDRFQGAAMPWFQETMAELDALVEASVPARTRHEAQLARRNLWYLVKKGGEGRAAGVEAWELLPQRLQGRISQLGRLVRDRQLQDATQTCLSILQTDPWAAEACSLVWRLRSDEPAESEAIDAARSQILARIDELTGIHESDPVTAHELLKFLRRIKDSDRQTVLSQRVRQHQPDFRFVDHRRWYRRGKASPSLFYELRAASNRSRSQADPVERLARLRELSSLLPEPLVPDPAVSRYFSVLLETGRELGGDEGMALQLEALEVLCELDSSVDPCHALAQLRYHQHGAPPSECLPLVQRALSRLEDELLWEPPPAGRAAFRFETHAAQVHEQLSSLRRTEQELLEASRKRSAPFSAARVDAWPSPEDAEGWLRLAQLPAEASTPALAREADLMALSLLDEEARTALSTQYREAAGRRFSRAHPVVEVAGADPWGALLAAADARRLRREKPPEPRPSHPFVGQEAPPLSVQDLEGRTIDLSELRGRVVVVDFWATWCGPCIKELPELQAAMDRLEGKPVTFLMLSVDSTPAPVGPFVAENGYRFDFAWIGVDGTKQDWLVRGIPSLFVLGPDGVVRAHHQGFSQSIGSTLEEEILELLAGG